MSDKTNAQNALKALASELAPGSLITEDEQLAGFLQDWRQYYQGSCLAAVAPESVQQVQASMKIAKRFSLGVVTQGGNTGQVGGAIPTDKNQLLVLTHRLNKIRKLDVIGQTMIVEAGVTLPRARAEAKRHNLNLAIRLGANIDCSIGGNVATNAGGLYAVRQGVSRRHVLGLEFVMPDGELISDPLELHKNNCGYSLTSLLIGSEGTLALITAVSLKLEPLTTTKITALCTFDSIAQAGECLVAVRDKVRGQLNAAELVPGALLNEAITRLNNKQGEQQYDINLGKWNLLIEVVNADWVRDDFVQALNANCKNAYLAPNLDEEAKFQDFLWQARGNVAYSQTKFGANLKHDISLPLDKIALFVDECYAALKQNFPYVMPMPFGHLGDGNLHFNLSVQDPKDSQLLTDNAQAISSLVFKMVLKHNGSLSAEHGIGQHRQDRISLQRSPRELELIRKIKHAFDPDGRMNPHKML